METERSMAVPGGGPTSRVRVTPYDWTYFDRGLETGQSLYQKYRWLPDQTIPLAGAIIDMLPIRPSDRVCDFGCAMGFLVKALRLLHRDAWGVDLSGYAISEAESDTWPFLLIGDEPMAPRGGGR